MDITDLLDDYLICAMTDMHGHTFRAALPDRCDPCYRSRCAGYCFDPETFKAHQQAIESIADETWIRAGKNHHRRPYRFGGDDFIRFIGWFVTEGSVYRPSDKDTATIQIAQQIEEHRQSIAALLDRMNFEVTTSPQYFKFGSHLFGRLLENLCGNGSRQKHLPSFVWSLCREQQQLLLDVLLAGDGNEQQTYYTASQRLKDDLCRLCVELRLKPRHTCRRGIWQIFISDTNDGFHSSRHVQEIPSSGPLYRLGVEDYPLVMAGQDGKFQWIGVSELG